MNEVQIVVDSTVDLSPEMVKENNLIVLPLHVAFKDDVRDYKDGIDITKLKRMVGLLLKQVQ